MARIRKTGVVHRPATQGRPFPQGKRKPSTAAKLQRRKRPRAAARAGTKCSENTVDKDGGATCSRIAVSKSTMLASARTPRTQPDDQAGASASRTSDDIEPGKSSDACTTSSSQTAVTVQAEVGPTCTATSQAADATNHLARSTDQAISTTYQAAGADDLFFCSYKKYYGPGRVTVGETYASTKQTCHVARIIDRRTSDLGSEYHVLWLIRRRSSTHYYQRTWEPKLPLAPKDFSEEKALVDC
ncbi:hypothetical protein JG688_00006164 [Phytophthora aleatoria]|uniref:Uncharacterized protein n=1 Tax=Phytophthora aleatoria TaxID=2496075 RepID=A0A8J5M923_9STRA|nr:hypothetical protein JG688_00006164 [Phytophthora aleatoria]